MKKTILYAAVTLIALASFSLNFTISQENYSAFDAIYAPLDDDEEDNIKTCVIPQTGTIGEYNPCTVGNTDCTPTNCS